MTITSDLSAHIVNIQNEINELSKEYDSKLHQYRQQITKRDNLIKASIFSPWSSFWREQLNCSYVLKQQKKLIIEAVNVVFEKYSEIAGRLLQGVTLSDIVCLRVMQHCLELILHAFPKKISDGMQAMMTYPAVSKSRIEFCDRLDGRGGRTFWVIEEIKKRIASLEITLKQSISEQDLPNDSNSMLKECQSALTSLNEKFKQLSVVNLLGINLINMTFTESEKDDDLVISIRSNAADHAGVMPIYFFSHNAKFDHVKTCLVMEEKTKLNQWIEQKNEISSAGNAGMMMRSLRSSYP